MIMKRTNNKLTPVYSILYKISIDGLPNNYSSFGLGAKTKTPVFSSKKAINIAKKLKEKGNLVRVYQYGWKERGFRGNEEQCKVIYQSKDF
jgi:hypothetical protein